jgi:hypothetical protein
VVGAVADLPWLSLRRRARELSLGFTVVCGHRTACPVRLSSADSVVVVVVVAGVESRSDEGAKHARAWWRRRRVRVDVRAAGRAGRQSKLRLHGSARGGRGQLDKRTRRRCARRPGRFCLGLFGPVTCTAWRCEGLWGCAA